MKLTYWIAMPTNDIEAFALRATTKKLLKEIIEDQKKFGSATEFNAPKKVVVEYENAFHLVLKCLDGQSSAYFE